MKKSKLGFLTKVSFERKVKTKWFLIANIILCLVIVGIANVDGIVKAFGGDFNKGQVIHVIDETGSSFDNFKTNIEELSKNLSQNDSKKGYEVLLSKKTVEENRKLLTEKDNKKDWVVVIKPDKDNYMEVLMISESYVNALDYQLINQSLNNIKSSLGFIESGISKEEVANIQAPVKIEREFIDDSKNSNDENMNLIMTTVFPIIILPFYMLSIMLIQMIGVEINDEKTTRGMEIIISNVSPETHFASKVIAGNLFVILQGVLMLAYSGIALLIKNIFTKTNVTGGLGEYVGNIVTDIMSGPIGKQLGYIIPLMLLLMIITLIAYSLLAGILASMTTNMEDFQQLQTPIIVISVIGYMLSIMAATFEGALFIRIMSYIPFISAILAPSLLMLGQIGIIDFIIAIIIMLGTIYILVKKGMKIYKVGILNYSSKDLWKKIFKAAK